MITKTHKNWLTAAVFIGAVAAPQAALAVQATAWGTIQLIKTGWAADTEAIFHSAAVINPAACTVTNDGYATLPTDPGRNLYHATALAAFLNGREVQLIIDGASCAFNKPRIIGVYIR